MPTITEPPVDGWVVNPSDVHMETAPMSDPDGDAHFCTDWEIWSLNPAGRVWFAGCVGNLEKVHAHLGDGQFEGILIGASQLDYNTDYILRVRHRDSSGEWSPYAERQFRSGSATAIFPMELDDILDNPAPTFTAADGTPQVLSPGDTVRIEAASGGLFLAFTGAEILNPASLAAHFPVRVVVSSDAGLALPATNITFRDDEGEELTIYLPSLSIAGERRYFWISANGSSYNGSESQSSPDFSDLAQGAPVPWQVVQNGYKVEVVATGFQLPVNIAFSPAQGSDPDSPYFYVTELYGNIKVVRRNGMVSNYASDLLNFDPTGNFPGSGEQGMAGIAVDPPTGDIYVSMLYDAAPPNGPHYPKVVRFTSNDGGLTAATDSIILDMPGEQMGQSHFISNVSIGPDHKLYVHLGDGFDFTTALNLNSYRGKILRLNLDGTAPADNPFYRESDGITATDYIFAFGFRNPFGGAWRAADSSLYEIENGPDINDRFAKVRRGISYGWNGTGTSLTTHAIYNWNPPHAPVTGAFIQAESFGGSHFPLEKYGNAFVTESGPTWASGPQARGKRIVEFRLDPNGNLISGPHTLVEYNGSGKATASGIAAGPDGLYFTDLYKDLDFITPIDSGANVLRISFVGNAEFEGDVTSGPVPLTVNFSDLSNVPDPSAWRWDFGDGQSSTAQNPSHTYATEGLYDVRLEVAGSNGVAIRRKSAYIAVGDILPGLNGEYYDDPDFQGTLLRRRDPNINFDWGGGSPDPTMGNDLFTVRWTGQVEPPSSGTYTFYTRTDDGVRLWVNGTQLVNQWVDQGVTEHSGSIALQGGTRYNIVMEYFENGGQAVAQLLWESAGVPKQIIPAANLFAPVISGIGDPPPHSAPRGFTLGQNYPNPFNPTTRIPFYLPAPARVNLRIFDLNGREVRRLAHEQVFMPGWQNLVWDARNEAGVALSSGIYFYKMEFVSLQGGAPHSDIGKMVLVR